MKIFDLSSTIINLLAMQLAFCATFHKISYLQHVVMSCTLSNSCPSNQPPLKPSDCYHRVAEKYNERHQTLDKIGVDGSSQIDYRVHGAYLA